MRTLNQEEINSVNGGEYPTRQILAALLGCALVIMFGLVAYYKSPQP